MAFFPRNFYNTSNDTSFTPLFRLLDDFDSYSRQSGNNNSCHGARRSVPTWQPKFDIRETGEAYELHGELPGMVKDNVHIEFVEPQTMLIRGKVERTYSAGTPPTGAAIEDTTMSGAITEGSEKSASPKPRQATVADENDDEEFTEVDKDDAEAKTAEKPAAVADHAKYWLTERSIGEFSRTFNFPARVEQDAVTASLKDGILNVTVPKAKKHEAVRISIN